MSFLLLIFRVLLFKFLVATIFYISGREYFINKERNEKRSRTYPIRLENGTYVPALMLGSPPEIHNSSHIRYFLTTKANVNIPQEIILGDLRSLQSSYFMSFIPTKILFHGFTGDCTNPSFPYSAIHEYLKLNEDLNLICVDWKFLAEGPFYNVAVDNTKVVGSKTAEFIEFLVRANKSSYSDFHLLGFSLGAHAAGITGNLLQGGRLRRITGLDPALPLFGSVEANLRLDTSDAEFVDVVHTAGGSMLEGGLAFITPLGHADFYPNSGQKQPGCDGRDVIGTCSHYRCPEIFSESILSQGFKSCLCSNWSEFDEGKCPCDQPILLGEKCPFNARGRYYLKTNPQSPYAKG